MPTEKGGGLDAKREQGCPPILDTTREEDKPEAIGLRKDGLGDEREA